MLKSLNWWRFHVYWLKLIFSFRLKFIFQQNFQFALWLFLILHGHFLNFHIVISALRESVDACNFQHDALNIFSLENSFRNTQYLFDPDTLFYFIGFVPGVDVIWDVLLLEVIDDLFLILLNCLICTKTADKMSFKPIVVFIHFIIIAILREAHAYDFSNLYLNYYKILQIISSFQKINISVIQICSWLTKKMIGSPFNVVLIGKVKFYKRKKSFIESKSFYQTRQGISK